MKKRLLSKEVSKLVSKEERLSNRNSQARPLVIASSRRLRGNPVKKVAFSTGLLRHFVPRNDKKSHTSALHNLLLTYLPTNLLTECVAFTMAEILLSLTIIGVVAAITLPSLTGNINERTWNTQRKALYSRMTQAIALMPALNGYGKLTGTINAEDRTQTITEDTAAETFITSGLSKVLKINNICDNEHLLDCGLPPQYIMANGAKKNMPTDAQGLAGVLVRCSHPVYDDLNTKTASFETANGESINVVYMPNCKPSRNETAYYMTQPKLCVAMLYDLNGKKGPNTVGKDIGFMTVFYPSDSVVSLLEPAIRTSSDRLTYDEAVEYCHNLGEEYRLPNKEEAASIVYGNFTLYGGPEGIMWTSSPIVKNNQVNYWAQGFGGDVQPMLKTSSNKNYAWCVKRMGS